MFNSKTFCSGCGTELTPTDNFCTQCGRKKNSRQSKSNPFAKFKDFQSRRGQAQENDLGDRMKMRRFKLPEHRTEDLIEELTYWLKYENYAHQKLRTEDDDVLIQVQKEQRWKRMVGMGSALNVVFSNENDILVVKIGSGKWLDKALAAGVGVLFMWPFAVTASYGAFKQATFPQKIFDFIEEYCEEMKLRTSEE